MTSTHEHLNNHGNGSDRRPDGAHAIAEAPAAGDYIDETVAFWQKRSKRQLSREDGREIVENLTGFFRVLQEWDRAERVARNKS